MIRATISETKNQLSALLKKVKSGESILILDRDTPIARIEPIQSMHEEKYSELIKTGLVRPAKEKPASLPEPVKIKGGVLNILLKERRDSR